MEKLRIIRQKIQQILKESFGVHEPTDELAVWLSNELIANLNYYHERGTLDFKKDIIKLQFTPPEDIVQKTFINLIKVNLNISDKGTINSISGGNFETRKTKRLVINNIFVYNIEINLNLNWDFKTNINTLLTSFFEHELHHAFTHIIKLNKKSKSKYLNMVSRMPVYDLQNTLEENPILKDFIAHFYLALPEEVNARVQEAYNDIKTHLNKSEEDLMKELYKTKPMIDAGGMLTYKTDKIFSLSKEVLDNFVIQFNTNMKTAINLVASEVKKTNDLAYTSDSIKYPQTDPTAFFKFWRRRINREGNKLFNKILKMVKKAKNSEEYKIESIVYIDSVILEEATGFNIEGYNELDF